MKRTFLVAVVLFLALILTNCGGGGGGPTLIVTDILSAGGVDDGDITLSGGLYTVVTSNQSPNTVVVDFQTALETRGFLTFSLASIPPTASIQKATVFLPILRATPLFGSASVALFPDMVTFPPLDTLTTQLSRGGVFNATAILQGPSFAVFPADAGFDVTFDATNAVIEANRPPPLSTLQIRLISGGGQVEIDDLLATATPMLRVEYF